MKCEHCGNPLKGTEKFCYACGNKVEFDEKIEPVTFDEEIKEEAVNENFEEIKEEIPKEEKPVVPRVTPIEEVNTLEEKTEEEIENETTPEVIIPEVSPRITKTIEDEQVVFEEKEKAKERGLQMQQEALENIKKETTSIPEVKKEPTVENTENNINVQKNKSNVGLITVLVLLFIGIGLVGAFGGYFLAQSNANSNTEEKEDSKEEEKQPVITTNNITVAFIDDTLILPEGFYYKYDNQGRLLIYNSEWQALITELQTTYSQILSKKEYLKTAFADKGWSLITSDEKIIGDREYLMFDISNGQYREIAAYTAYDSKVAIAIDLTSLSQTSVNDEWLKEVNEILDNKKSIDKNTGTIEKFEGASLKETFESIKIEETLPNQ